MVISLAAKAAARKARAIAKQAKAARVRIAKARLLQESQSKKARVQAGTIWYSISGREVLKAQSLQRARVKQREALKSAELLIRKAKLLKEMRKIAKQKQQLIKKIKKMPR